MPIIEVNNLIKSFGQRVVLNNISFNINQGEIIVIMGGSGCGKSTLLKHFIGMLQPDSGNIFIKGKDINEMSAYEFEKLKKKFGMLFQGAALFNSMTIGENVALPLVEHTDFDKEIIDIVVKMKLEMVGLTGFEDLKPAEISGGMKKRVGLARAIVLDPEIIFYDEPGSGLDPIMTAVIDKLIVDLSQKLGITSIVVTHEMQSAFHIADRIIMLYNGKIQQIGTVSEIKNSKNPVVKQFISGSPDGPIPMQRSSEDYLKHLLGES